MALKDGAVRLYGRFLRWLSRHWGLILEIVICLILLTLGLIVGLIIVMARLAGFIGSGGNPFF